MKMGMSRTMFSLEDLEKTMLNEMIETCHTE